MDIDKLSKNLIAVAKCQCLIYIFTKKIRIIFRERYQFENGQPYDINNNPKAAKFYNDIKKEIIEKSETIYKHSASNIDCWNHFTLISYLTKNIPNKIENIEKFKKENEIFKKLINIIELSLTPFTPEMPELINLNKKLYKELCELNGEVVNDQQLTLLLDTNQDKVNSKLIPGYIINQDLENQCLKFKEEGNEYFKNNEFSKAIEQYTNAIKLIYSNKNQVSFKTKSIYY